MTEDQLLRCVIDLAHVHHWRVAHFRPARTERGYRTAVQGDGVGFPDLLMLRGGRMVVAELKGERGRLTTEQHDWIAAFDLFLFPSEQKAVYVWRPAHWPEAIEAVLR